MHGDGGGRASGSIGGEHSDAVSDEESRRERYSLLLDELSRSLLTDSGNLLLEQYGRILSNHRERSADELTVDNDYYWAGVTAMKFLDPRLLYARVLLLMKEGWVNRAWHTVMFTGHSWWYIRTEDQLASYSRYLAAPATELQRIAVRLAPVIGDGLDRNALQLWDEAIEVFDGVLEEFPSLSHAHAGKGAALSGRFPGDEEAGFAAAEHFRLARSADPFWSRAYMRMGDSGKARRLMERSIAPDLQRIRNWTEPSQVEYAVLYRFAGNCRFIGAEEYAVYALMMALELICLRGDGDPRYAIWEISDTLRAMGRPLAAEAFLEAHKLLFALK